MHGSWIFFPDQENLVPSEAFCYIFISQRCFFPLSKLSTVQKVSVKLMICRTTEPTANKHHQHHVYKLYCLTDHLLKLHFWKDRLYFKNQTSRHTSPFKSSSILFPFLYKSLWCLTIKTTHIIETLNMYHKAIHDRKQFYLYSLCLPSKHLAAQPQQQWNSRIPR